MESESTSVWRRVPDQAEEDQRLRQIDQIANDFNRFAQSQVRATLTRATEPEARLVITVGSGSVTFGGKGQSVTVPTDGSKVRVSAPNGEAVLSARITNGVLNVTAQAANGTRTTAYRMSDDGTRLVTDIQMAGTKLPQPIRYRVSYVRHESR